MSNIIDSNEERFSKDIPTKGIAVVDFWASWCGPCLSFAPIFESSAELHPDILHLKIDVDANPELASTYEVQSIPTTMFLRDGVVVGRFPGALSAPRLEDLLFQTRELDMVKVHRQRK